MSTLAAICPKKKRKISIVIYERNIILGFLIYAVPFHLKPNTSNIIPIIKKNKTSNISRKQAPCPPFN